MNFRTISVAFSAGLTMFGAVCASAATVSWTGDFRPMAKVPAAVTDTGPGDFRHIMFFNEMQNYTLSKNLKADDGTIIRAGTTIDSHMFFLNRKKGASKKDSPLTVKSGTLTFASEILGTISDQHGKLLLASDYLGGSTTYQQMRYRGIGSEDRMSFAGNTITVDSLRVRQPGDWVRIVTLSTRFSIGTEPSPVPVPAGILLLPLGLGALGAFGRRRKNA